MSNRYGQIKESRIEQKKNETNFRINEQMWRRKILCWPKFLQHIQLESRSVEDLDLSDLPQYVFNTLIATKTFRLVYLDEIISNANDLNSKVLEQPVSSETSENEHSEMW